MQVIKQLNNNNSNILQSGSSTTEESGKVQSVGRVCRMIQTEFKILCYADDANTTGIQHDIPMPKTKFMTISN